jgi:hypothetical protein
MPSPDPAKKKQKNPVKVTADYGGRRETLDRRWQPEPIDHPDRRSEKERRSGFDRRSSLPPETGEDSPDAAEIRKLKR